jgi:hypothetical protein
MKNTSQAQRGDEIASERFKIWMLPKIIQTSDGMKHFFVSVNIFRKGNVDTYPSM